MSVTSRLGLSYPAGTDPADVPAWMNALAVELDGMIAPTTHGPFGSRPTSSVATPGIADRMYYATDVAPDGSGRLGVLYRDNGTGWDAVGYVPDGGITSAKAGAKTIYTATLTVNTGLLAISPTWTLVIDLNVTTVGIQTLDVHFKPRVRNEHATNKPNICFRVRDMTAAGAPTIYRDDSGDQFGVSGGGADAKTIARAFHYTTPAGGARILRLEASADIGGSMRVNAPAAFAGDSFASPTIEACVV